MLPHAVDDLASLQALTHPIRLRVLSRLRTDGPATAADLSRALGESRGALSYHLRQLERFGFVVSADDPDDARLRRWSATAPRTTIDRSVLRRDPAAAEAALAITRAQVAPVLDAIAEVLSDGADEGWSDATMSLDHELRLDSDQLREMRAELEAVLERYADTPNTSSAARTVAVYLAAAPERQR